MRSIRESRYDRLMDELGQEFRKGKIVEQPLDGATDVLDGAMENGVVYVDPVPSVVETLLHELIHRRYPKWAESTVTRTAHKLVTAMSTEERRYWHRAYQRTVTRRTATREIA